MAAGVVVHNCYQDSKPGQPHADIQLLETLFGGLDLPPYQIALGGGEPCEHPDLPDWLRFIRGKETVPSFTTAGHRFRSEVIDATNEVCGGVALTFHRHAGIKRFCRVYREWSEALAPHVQLNIHVIAKKDVVEALDELRTLLPTRSGDGHGVRIVLLAYYPDVGRASWVDAMSKDTYNTKLPQAIQAIKAWGADVAFSDGLGPYFMFRNLVDTTSLFPMEGTFSCYIDRYGRMYPSSFEAQDVPPEAGSRSIHTHRTQELWEKYHHSDSYPDGPACDRCPARWRCPGRNFPHVALCGQHWFNRKETA